MRGGGKFILLSFIFPQLIATSTAIVMWVKNLYFIYLSIFLQLLQYYIYKLLIIRWDYFIF